MTLAFTAQCFGQEECGVGRYDRTFFKSLKEANFMPMQNIRDDSLVLMLASCLGDPDPTLRDGIAYEGITTLLRRGRISNPGKRMLLEKCAGYINAASDENGFIKPFAALCMAEVARADRIEPYLSEEIRARVVRIGSDYLESISDYRGFDEEEGWRHGVAHTADLLMQLSLNDNVTVDQQREMLSAIATQVSPREHFYTYGEPSRLARPVLFMAMRSELGEAEWSNWFNALSSPGPELKSWEDAFSSQAGLAKRHNLQTFLSSLYLSAENSDNDAIKILLPVIKAAIQEIP